MNVFENQTEDNTISIISQTEKLGIEFIEIISKDEIENCKNSFSNIVFTTDINSQPMPVLKLEYQAFYDIIKSEKSKFCKFYLLPEINNFMTWGITFSDTDDLKQSIDIYYLLIGNTFVKQNINISAVRSSGSFTIFKDKIKEATGNNNCCEMVLYEREMILDYLNFMETLASLTKGTIADLEFHYIFFKDFERKDKALLNYKEPKENRISFAVKTNFTVDKDTNRNLQDLLNAYYDAGDLKP